MGYPAGRRRLTRRLLHPQPLLVQITRVHLGKHHLQLEAVRYGLHFLGAAPFEDQAVDRAPPHFKEKTPAHRHRSLKKGFAPKKQKPPKQSKKKLALGPNPRTVPGRGSGPGAHPDSGPGRPVSPPPRPTPNPILRNAIEAPGAIDQRMIATLPIYWQVYYHKDVELKQHYRP